MRFVTYNVGYGMSRNGGGNLDRIAEAVDGADVIALQEVERFWPRSGMVDQPRQLGKRLPGYWWVFGPNIDLHSSETFPGEEADRRRQFGNMLLARRPILASRNIALACCSHLPFSMAAGRHRRNRGSCRIDVAGLLDPSLLPERRGPPGPDRRHQGGS